MSLTRALVPALVALLAPALTACGGGGGGGGAQAPTLQSTSVFSAPALGGWVSSGGVVGPDTANPNGPRAGGGGLLRTKGIITFELPIPPAGATLVSATLRTYQVSVLSSVYTNLGPCKVDHILLGAALDAFDYGSPSLQAAFAMLSTDATLETKSLDVSAQVLADITAGRGHSSYRVYFDPPSPPTGPSGLAEFSQGATNTEPTAVPTSLELVWQLP